MLDDLYQAETNTALNDLAARPPAPKPQAAKFSAWRALAGPVRGAGVGANEGAGGMADVIGAFGQVLGATDARTSMFSPQTPEQKKQEAQARDQMLNRGLQFDAGDQFRSVAREWMPDPVTTHWSESVTFGLGRFATKAITYTALAGPAGGAALTGLDEGLTAADELKQQGVDLGTRSAVGAVAGVAGAAGVLLPVAGKGVAQTAALVAAGGPGAFIGQQAATRAILENADYTQIAGQYDPFDPVGLAVATLVPAGFGAMALRGAKLRARAGEAVPNPEQSGAVVNDQMTARPTPEQVDAARVEMLTQHIEAAKAAEANDPAAWRAHDQAFTRAMDQLASGERVSVQDVAPVTRVQTLAEFADGFKSADQPMPPDVKSTFFSWLLNRGGINAMERLDITGEAAGVRGNPGGIFRSGGRGLDELARQAETDGYLPPGTVDSEGDNGGTRAMAELIRRATSGDHPLTMAEQVAKAQRDQYLTGIDQQVSEIEAKLRALGVDPAPAKGSLSVLQAYEKANGPALLRAALDELATVHTHDFMPGAVDGLEAKAAQIADDIQTAGRTLLQYEAQIGVLSPVMRRMVQRKLQEPTTNVQDAPQARTDAPAGSARQPEQGAQSQAADARSPGQDGAGAQGGGVSRAGSDAAEAAVVAARLADVSQQFPDLTVQMDGMDKPMPLSDFLAQVQREAMEGTDFDLGGNDAPLMQVAASCFLLNG